MFQAMSTQYIRCGDRYFGINPGAGISDGKRYVASWTVLGPLNQRQSRDEVARGVLDDTGIAVVWTGLVSMTVLNSIEEAWRQHGKG